MEEPTDLIQTDYSTSIFFEEHGVGFAFQGEVLTIIFIGEEDRNPGVQILLDAPTVRAIEAGLLALKNVVEGENERRLH